MTQQVRVIRPIIDGSPQLQLKPPPDGHPTQRKLRPVCLTHTGQKIEFLSVELVYDRWSIRYSIS